MRFNLVIIVGVIFGGRGSLALTNNVQFFSGTVASPFGLYDYYLGGNTVFDNIYNSLNTTGLLAAGAVLVAASLLFAIPTLPQPHEIRHALTTSYSTPSFNKLDINLNDIEYSDHGSRPRNFKVPFLASSSAKRSRGKKKMVAFSYQDKIKRQHDDDNVFDSNEFVPFQPTTGQPLPPLQLDYQTGHNPKSKVSYRRTYEKAGNQKNLNRKSKFRLSSVTDKTKQIKLTVDKGITRGSLVKAISNALSETLDHNLRSGQTLTEVRMQKMGSKIDHDDPKLTESTSYAQHIPYLNQEGIKSARNVFKTKAFLQRP